MTQFRLSQISDTKFHVINVKDSSIVGSVSVSSPEEVQSLLRYWAGPVDLSQRPSLNKTLVAAFSKEKPMSKAAVLRGC
jgi:hypothetical protein